MLWLFFNFNFCNIKTGKQNGNNDYREQLIKALALLAAGLSMGLGAVGPGIGEGFVGGKACESIKRPDEATLLKQWL